MTMLMKRSFMVAMGWNPPNDLAYVWSDYRGRHRVTWAEVMEHRRARQTVILERKRQHLEMHAYKLWVAYYDQFPLGGWHGFLETYTGYERRHWIDQCDWLCDLVMETFPIVLPLGNRKQQWELWQKEFATQYRRRTQDGQPLGVTYVWWDTRYFLKPVI